MLAWPISYEEPVFRPPSEARALILQATVGCSWNRCTYCAMYRTKEYRLRSIEDLSAEIRRAACSDLPPRRVFLADGDALIAPQDHLEELLEVIAKELPDVTRVGIYGDSRSILGKGLEGLERLRERGLGIVYFGAETGDAETLKRIRKGATVERQVEASQLVMAAGMKLSVMVLIGLAGRQASERHARATGAFLRAAGATFSAALTVTPVPGTELEEEIRGGQIELPDRWGSLAELEWMLDSMEGYRGIFHANHASNYLPLKLRLPRDRESALKLLREVREKRDESLLRPEFARGL